MMANGYRVSFRGDENVLYEGVVMAARLCEYTKPHCVVQFKRVNFMVGELCLNDKRRGT